MRLASRPVCAPWVLVLPLVLAMAACSGGGASSGATAPVVPPAKAPEPIAGIDPGKPGICGKAADGARGTVPGLAQGQPEVDAHLLGMWSPVFDWPLIPVHAALTPDGRVMTYGTTREGRQTGRFDYAVWDPSAGTGANSYLTLPNTTTTDLFCGAQILLPQSGRLFLAGGDNFVAGQTTNTGTAETAVFDPATNQLSQGAQMFRPRWYGTPTMLGNGEVLLVGGKGNPDLPAVPQRAEVRRADGGFRLLSNVDTTPFNTWYPRAFTAGDGRVFGFEVDGGAYFLDPAGEGRLSPVGQIDVQPVGATSSVASYAPGRLLVAGGRSVAAVTVEFDGPLPVIRPTAPLSAVREYVNLTVLPDGTVLASGGSGLENTLQQVTNQAEIWSPVSGAWTVGASGQVPRLYHSVGLLLPDASVLVGGGGAPGPLTNTNAELYFPPYLFEAGGRWAARPTITAAPTVLDPGQPLSVTVDSLRPIRRLTLVKTGSVTHSLNVDQRFVELPFTATGNRLVGNLPRNAGELPPGFWMVFAIDDRGVPSVASILRVNVASTEALSTGWTPSIGGVIRAQGTRFAATCDADEVMVGVRGTTQETAGGPVVGRVQPLCARPDALGRWAGVPQVRGVPAGTGEGPVFERVCATSQAVSGLEARAGASLDGLRLRCAPLGGARTVSGASTLLERAGGAGGVDHPPVACADGKASTGVYGLYATSVQSLGLVCGATVADPRRDTGTVPPIAPPPPPVTPPTC